jgi:hypothetical protein
VAAEKGKERWEKERKGVEGAHLRGHPASLVRETMHRSTLA